MAEVTKVRQLPVLTAKPVDEPLGLAQATP